MTMVILPVECMTVGVGKLLPMGLNFQSEVIEPVVYNRGMRVHCVISARGGGAPPTTSKGERGMPRLTPSLSRRWATAALLKMEHLPPQGETSNPSALLQLQAGPGGLLTYLAEADLGYREVRAVAEQCRAPFQDLCRHPHANMGGETTGRGED